jgi:hypothetical protein
MSQNSKLNSNEKKESQVVKKQLALSRAIKKLFARADKIAKNAQECFNVVITLNCIAIRKKKYRNDSFHRRKKATKIHTHTTGIPNTFWAKSVPDGTNAGTSVGILFEKFTVDSLRESEPDIDTDPPTIKEAESVIKKRKLKETERQYQMEFSENEENHEPEEKKPKGNKSEKEKVVPCVDSDTEEKLEIKPRKKTEIELMFGDASDNDPSSDEKESTSSISESDSSMNSQSSGKQEEPPEGSDSKTSKKNNIVSDPSRINFGMLAKQSIVTKR